MRKLVYVFFFIYRKQERSKSIVAYGYRTNTYIYIYTDLKDIETLEIGEVISSNFSLCNLYDNIEKGRSVYAMQMLIDKT